jgi:uncharacterized protein YqjF (DUF2071 family)
MRLTWNELLFAHWPVPAAALAPHIPAGLTLDTYEGQAWVGVVPFHMTGVRVRGLPPIPTAARFAEINLRTYVVAGEKPGVWFFSLDAASPLAVAIARATFFLPYFNARFSIQQRDGAAVEYTSRRTHRGAPPGEFAGWYRPTGPVFQTRRGTLEDWLTARYCLYSLGAGGRLFRGEIHHAPWPLQIAEAEITRNTLASGQGITLPDTAPLLHYAHQLEVLCWPIGRVRGE